uniref:Meiosis 1 associated protein n=1 Tax=Salvator merianae TaxID=96440 RepID=A0A8D0CFM9_SALMN
MHPGRQVNTARAGLSVALSWQPPRILVIDIRAPHWTHTCHKICDALENVFTLACGLTGPPRIPLFSIYVVRAREECLLPFVAVKGSFSRLQSCLAELRALPTEGGFRPRGDAVSQAVQDGLQQFKQYTGEAALAQSILTSQHSTEVAKQLEDGLQGINLLSLRQLQVVEISGEGIQAPTSAPHASPSNPPPSLLRIVDLQTVENDVPALESFFKGWLHDHGANREHLHLLLPTGAQGRPGANPVCVKCDVQERFLSPALLPAPPTPADTPSPPLPKVSGCQDPPLSRAACHCRALRTAGLCASVVFGLPLVVFPTSCWQLSWDELESNQQRFQALCHFLRQWALLTQCDPPSTAGPRWSLSASSSQVLLPSGASSLLLCSVASQELLLPCSFSLLPADLPETALAQMESILDGLEVEPTYNPLGVTTHLYRALRSILALPTGPHSEERTSRDCPAPRPARKVPAAAAEGPLAPTSGAGTAGEGCSRRMWVGGA